MRGRVWKSTGSWYEVVDENQFQWNCRLRGKMKLAGLKTTNPIAVGDWVVFEPENETQGLISEIEERENYIIRKSVHKTGHGHILAANLDLLVVLATLTLPRTSLGFIDRLLVSAESFRIPALVVFNKTDLLDEEGLDVLANLQGLYEHVGYPTLAISALEGEGLEALRSHLSDKTTLIAGHSGVGKSTLLNALKPDLDLRTGEVSTFANKGKHTTTFAEMFALWPGALVVDTPGIKELGTIDMEDYTLAHFFPEMRQLIGQCKYHNCRHVNEPGCAVLPRVEKTIIPPSRYQSYLSMLFEEDSHRG